jgi:hypothetical protein
MSESNIKTIHGLVIVQGALLQALAWKEVKKTELNFEFSQQFIPLIQRLNKAEHPDKELIVAVNDAYKSISAQLPRNTGSSI